ncbi:sce7725 family protein [Pseudomonas sp. CNPSo 3701]|uniref:sce7725 family protein n=1 Tax=Pseudomonas sp. CNPSo 3701 TaxID=3027943 RepID=UPI0023637415|nr:sce7725 family protein [Pseudomonas sp. CNPSo 3701]MDD1509550.1 sce7725 family protein [Pseudomonas sp. CNPSo 3701]
MYYPILKAKRHELSSVVELSSAIKPVNFRPVLEPVNGGLAPLIKTIEKLYSNLVIPLVVINPSQGDFSKVSSAGLYSDLQSDSRSANKFLPCVKIKDATDIVSLSLLLIYPSAAVYLESNISSSSLGQISKAPLVLLNSQKNDPAIVSAIGSVVVYSDSFAKRKRNADYGQVSYYSGAHTSYHQAANVIGFGDFTIMGEEYTGSGGPAYVVAIHASYIESNGNNTMYVRHFCSSSDSEITANTPGKYKEALKELIMFDKANPGVFDKTLGMSEFYDSYSTNHFPGLGLVKEMSIKHHIETICNFIA